MYTYSQVWFCKLERKYRVIRKVETDMYQSDGYLYGKFLFEKEPG